MSSTVSIRGVLKRYGNFIAVNGASLEINAGEFFTLLGPSGCGKTTLLRMIAGFNTVDEGDICFGDKSIKQVEAHKRDIGMVFQNYAIFPHMNVAENVGYGLKAKKCRREELEQRVNAALQQVQIEALAARKPNELSGGQQQRVALARAFVIEPGVLLMDEPLSNLDAKLRVQMRTVIKRLQKSLGITTIYVTHDQEEALAISDRIAVMKDGNIMQVGTPEQIYIKPQNVFVAGFIGTSNLMEAEAETLSPGMARLTLDECSFDIPVTVECKGKKLLCIRPEHFRFAQAGLCGKVTLATFLGDFMEYEVVLASGQTVQVNVYTKDVEIRYAEGTEVHLNFDPVRAGVYDPLTGEVLSC